jgi:predicted acyltransferase
MIQLSSALAPQSRLLSLDVLPGLTIVFMSMVINADSGGVVADATRRSERIHGHRSGFSHIHFCRGSVDRLFD